MSGSGLDNISNETFDCRLSEQSSLFITNVSHWQIEEGKEVGAIIIGVIVLLFFLVGTSWNLFIIITFFVKYELLKEPANIFLLNVAFTDLLICLTSMVFSFVTAFGQEFVFGDNDVTRCAVCNLSGFFLVYLIQVSVHLLAALSVDRFILLSRPLRYKRFMNRWKAIVICIVIYIICSIIAVLPQVGFGQMDFNRRLAACVPRFTPRSNLLYVIIAIAEALIPITIIAVTNVWTYRFISKFLKKNFRRKSTYRRREVEESSSGGSEGHKHQKQQKQLVKVFGALLIGNIISYTPTMITTFIFLFLSVGNREDSFPAELFILGFVSYNTSAVIHPIVESFFVKELRYQVHRAKVGVRRVSTSIYRQTTQLFSNKTLEEAAQKADDNSTPTPKRPIRFLNGRIATSGVGESTMAETMISEVPSTMDDSRSSPDLPDTSVVVEESKGNGTSKTNERGIPMLGKARKSVSFQDPSSAGSRPHSASSPVSPVGTPTGSCLKHIPEVDTITESRDEEEEGDGTLAETTSESAETASEPVETTSEMAEITFELEGEERTKL